MSAYDRDDWMRPFGRTGITVSAVCMGGAQLGSMPELFGYEVTEQDAIGLVRRVLDSPIRFLDTSNGYGGGRSEERIGRAVRDHGGLPTDFVISTKVDAWMGTTRVSASVRRSAKAWSGSASAGCRLCSCTIPSSTRLR